MKNFLQPLFKQVIRTAFVCLLVSAAGTGGFAQTISSYPTASPGTFASGCYGTAADALGNVYVADYSNGKVYKITSAGTVTPITNALISGPVGIAIDAANNLYVSDDNTNHITKITSAGVVSDFLDMTGYPGIGCVEGITIDPSGTNLYVTDYCAAKVYKVVISTKVISTICGTGSSGNTGDGAIATAAALGSSLEGLAVDASNNIYIPDVTNNRVRVIAGSSTAGHPVIGNIYAFASSAGLGAGFSGDGAAATSAKLNNPTGVAVDAAGNVYIADVSNHRIRMVNTSGIISTFGGSNTATCNGGNGGAVSSATFSSPYGLWIDAAGAFYISDQGCTQVRYIAPACSVPASPGAIAGSAHVCAGQSGIIYSIAASLGATSYAWTLPSGASIVGAATNNSITVNFSGGATSGNITVLPSNVCGNALLNSSLAITVGGALNGNYTIDNTIGASSTNFSSIAGAIAALNCLGVSGAVTFNVKPGLVETFTSATAGWINLPSINTASTPIVFKKNGAGANPKINAIGTSGGDAGILIQGVSYITIDGLDVFDNGTSYNNYVEYGIALSYAGHPCAHDTVRNCTITLNTNDTWADLANASYLNNNTSFYTTIGIYQSYDNSAFTAGINSTIPAFGNPTNSFNGYTGNTILGAGFGILISGNAIIGTAETNTYIANNILGTAGVNAIGPIEGEGIHIENSTSATIINNTIVVNVMQVLSDANYDGVYGIYINGGSAITVSGNTITVSSSGFLDSPADGTANGIGYTGSVTGTSTIANNSIKNGTVSYRNFSGIFGNGTATTMNINGNTITNITSPLTNGIPLTGINLTGAISGSIDNVFNNSINTFTTPSVCTGIANAAATGICNIYNNKVHSLSGTGSSSFSYGLNVSGGSTQTIYNNFVANLSAKGNNIYGAFINTSTAPKFYYNSIYLNQTVGTGTSFTPIGVMIFNNTGGTAVDARDNLVINTSTPGASGTAIALDINGATPLSGYASTSDYNCWYAGTPGTQHVILSCSSGNDQTLLAFQTRVSTRDAHSISINPTFTSSTDLHTTTAGLAAGIPIGGFPADIDGDTRNATTPIIGADEFFTCATPGTPTAIAGITARCAGPGTNVYTSTSSNATAYTWSITGTASGNSISGTGTSATVTWGASFAGTATISVTGNCGALNSSTTTLNVPTNAATENIATFPNSNTVSINSNYGIVVDAAGNLYNADYNNNKVYKMTPAGVVTLFFTSPGGGPVGLAVDPTYPTSGSLYMSDYNNNTLYKVNAAGTPAVFASGGVLNGPEAIARDAAGNIYVWNYNSGTISKVNTAGVASNFAGTGVGGNGGDNGPALSATLGGGSEGEIAVDALNNVYFADNTTNNRVRIIAGVSTTRFPVVGNIYAFAGTGGTGSGGDGGLATAATLNIVNGGGLKVDAEGSVYISDKGNNKIRRVDQNGIISTYAGTTSGLFGDGGPASAAKMNAPYTLAIDASENIYVLDAGNSRVREIYAPQAPSLPTGSVSICMGSAPGGYTASSIGASSYTWSITAAAGSVSGTGTSATVTWTSTYTGTATLSVTASSGCGTTPATTLAVVVNPITVYTTPSVPSGATSRCVGAGTGVYTSSSAGATSYAWSVTAAAGSISGTGTSATVTWNSTYSGAASVSVIASAGCATSAPASVTVTTNPIASTINTFPGTLPTSGTFGSSIYYGTGVDASGNLYVADWSNWRIIKATPAGVVTTLASNASNSLINGPVGIAFDGTTNLYVTEDNLGTITKITTAGVVSAFVSTGAACIEGLAIDAAKANLYATDYCAPKVLKITIPGGVISTVGGTGTAGNTGDGGPATAATIGTGGGGLEELAVDANNNIYIADPGNHRVRIIAGVSTTRFPVVGNIYNFAGSSSGTSGNSGDAGLATSALLNWPTGVRVDANGNVYISDVLNHNVRVVNPAGYISTFVNTASTSGNSGDGSIATSATLTGPYGLNFDASGNLFIVDQGSSKVREVYAPLIPALNGTVTLRCQGANTSVYTAASSGATSYNWSVTGSGNSVAGSGTSATVTWAAGFTGTSTVSVTATNGCGNTPASTLPVVTSANVSTPSIPFGPTSRCIGGGTGIYTVGAVSGATSYNWSVSGAGNTITGTSNSATVTWSAGYSGVSTVSVAAANPVCGAGPSSGIFVSVNPQLSGTYTVDNSVSGVANLFPNTNTFNSVASAIATLNNNCGILAPGVTFNVKAGIVETFATPTAGWINLSTINTSATPIVFRKNGAGANPLLKVIGTSGGDAGIFLEGVSYVTIDGIDVFDNGTSFSNYVEYGIALCNLGTVHGCQHDTIRNCTITLNPNDAWPNDPSYSNYINNTTLYTTIGIYQGMDNATFTGYGSFLPCSSTGSNSFNSYYSNTIAGAGMGFVLWGGTCAFDTNNDIGTLGGNTIGTSGSPIGLAEAQGVHAQNQTNFRITNNTIKLNATLVAADANYDGVYGIYINGGQSTQEVDNNTITASSNGFLDSPIDAACAGIGFAGTSSGAVNIHHNTISNAVVAYRNFSGIYDNGAGTPMNIYNNTISGNAVSSNLASSSLYGIQTTTTATGTMNVYNNQVSANSTTTTNGSLSLQFNGIAIGNGSGTGKVYNNKVFTMTTTGSNTSFVYGMNISGGANLSIYNNFISDFHSSAYNIYGAFISSTSGTVTPNKFYYNSININQTTVPAIGWMGAYGLAVLNGASNLVDARNNIVINNSVVGNSSGLAVALFGLGTGTDYGGYATTSNNNDYYAGTPDIQHLIYRANIGSYQTLTGAGSFSAASGRDLQSITINPAFTSATDLHKTNMTYPGYLYLIAGQPIAGYTTDIDGDVRNATTPDIGADEFIACEPSRAGAITGTAIVCQNDLGVTYSVASIAGATGYDWTLPTGGSIATGSNTNIITVNYSAAAAAGSVTVSGTDVCGSGLSSSFAVTVKPIPLVDVTPNNAVCTGGTTATLVASGAVSYTWSPTTNLTPTNGTAATETAQISALTIYTVIGTGSNGCTASDVVPVATVAVGGTISPIYSIICSGGTKLLTVSGAAGHDYQWQISGDNSSWTPITGATNTTYTTNTTDGNTNKYYRLLAQSNSCWNVASTTAEVDVSQPVINVTASAITDNSVLLSWLPIGQGNYNISYTGTSSGTVLGTTPPKTLTGLTANGSYTIILNQTGTGLGGCPASGTVNINTLCPAPPTVTVISTGTTSITLSWSGGAGNYRVYYRPLYAYNGYFTRDVINGTSATLTTQGGTQLYHSVTYEIYITRLDCPGAGNIGQASAKIYATTTPALACAAPVIDSVRSLCPVQIEVWVHGSPTNQYYIDVERLTPTVQPVTSYPVTGSYFTMNVSAGQNYLISARSICGGGVSNLAIWPGTLQIKPQCTSVANLLLSNPTCSGFTASWNADQCIANNASYYQLFLRQVGTINWNGYGVTIPTFPIGPYKLVNWLGKGKTFDVFAKAVYSCNGYLTYGATTQTLRITTLSAGCREEATEDPTTQAITQQTSLDNSEVFSLYPNPNNGQFTVDLNRLNNNEDAVRIEVSNMLGQTILTHLTSISDGHLTEFINLPASTTAGTYVVRLTAGKNVYTGKINISK